MGEAGVEGLADALVACRAWAVELDVEALVGACDPCRELARGVYIRAAHLHSSRSMLKNVKCRNKVRVLRSQARRELLDGRATRFSVSISISVTAASALRNPR